MARRRGAAVVGEVGLDVLVLALALCIGTSFMAVAFLMLDVIFLGVHILNIELFASSALGALAIGSLLGTYARYPWVLGIVLVFSGSLLLRTVASSPGYPDTVELPLAWLQVLFITLGAIVLTGRLKLAYWAREGIQGRIADFSYTSIRVLLAVFGLAGAGLLSLCVPDDVGRPLLLRAGTIAVFISAFAVLLKARRI